MGPARIKFTKSILIVKILRSWQEVPMNQWICRLIGVALIWCFISTPVSFAMDGEGIAQISHSDWDGKDDPISNIPFELFHMMLADLDTASLGNASLVNRYWNGEVLEYVKNNLHRLTFDQTRMFQNLNPFDKELMESFDSHFKVPTSIILTAKHGVHFFIPNYNLEVSVFDNYHEAYHYDSKEAFLKVKTRMKDPFEEIVVPRAEMLDLISYLHARSELKRSESAFAQALSQWEKSTIPTDGPVEEAILYNKKICPHSHGGINSFVVERLLYLPQDGFGVTAYRGEFRIEMGEALGEVKHIHVPEEVTRLARSVARSQRKLDLRFQRVKAIAQRLNNEKAHNGFDSKHMAIH